MNREGDREFYASCTIAEYWNRFAKNKMRLEHNLKALSTNVSKNRLFLVDNQIMASNTHSVISKISDVLGFRPQVSHQKSRHYSKAENADIDVPEYIHKQLSHTRDIPMSFHEYYL